MGLRQLVDLVEYRHLLADDPQELHALFSDLLIGVTQFFRDPPAWEILKAKVLSPLVESASDRQVIRAWCPGCATGEEAYTLAILLHEQLSLHNKRCRIQIFASDIAHDALEHARRGIYPEAITSDISNERRRRFFIKRSDADLRVSKELRESVVFAEQDILSHPPFSKLDLICCRNLLIYLEPDAQKQLTSVFDFALKPEGYLILGNAEALKSHRESFTTISQEWRIFSKI